MPPHQFPRRSGAQLYPGMPEYVGIAAILNDPDGGGEVVILAPNFTALQERAAKWGLPVLDRAKCKTSELLPKPGLTIDEPCVVQSELQNAS